MPAQTHVSVANSPRPFAGQVAIVTGSTRGIGAAAARLLAERGASVVITSRTAEACEAVEAQLRHGGGSAIGVKCHVGKAEDREALVARTLDRFGRIDIFVANAAVNPVFASIQDYDEQVWNKVLDTNLTGTWLFSKLVLPEVARHGGSMVIVSSTASVELAPMSPAYAVAKAAENHLTRQLAAHWGPSGVRVNCVVPGATRTDMLRNVPAETRDRLAAATQLRRIGEPEDVAEAILFLASGAARQITGQCLFVDGGATL